MAALLIKRTPAFTKAYFLNSGSEVTEAALKLARQHWLARGESRRHRVIALKPSYHGNTLLALSASAREHYKTYFGQWLIDVTRIQAPDPYRCPCGGSGHGCDICSGDVLAEAIGSLGADTVAAFIAEPIGGSSSGAMVPNAQYWRRVREICDQTGVLLIADEILCGAGRTGSWTAIETWDVEPDILTLGKGIASGYAALSAVLTTERVIDPIIESGKSFVHAQTFSHHAVACAAGVATLRYLDANGLVPRSAEMGRVFHSKLASLRGLPHVGDIRGRGLLAGVEFVADVDSREPFARSERFTERFVSAARALGLVVWPNIGNVDGERGDIIMLAPPFIVTTEELDEIIQRFTSALEATLGVAPARPLGASAT
jgi:adenosylmethionine-8-amino-7-oxononanoate aminotransferase